MKYGLLRNLKDKVYFSANDISEILGIKINSAKVLCSRYTKKGLIIKLKREFYILKEKWGILSTEEYFKIGNILQVPSYISLMTALSYYGITTQIQRGFYESICLKRSKTYIIDNITFSFYKISPSFYTGFEKVNDFFIAEKEKAFLDAIYLSSLGRYKFDIPSIDIEKLDIEKLRILLNIYPERTKKIISKIWKI